ncbi:unnamed protein product [Rhizoctonia solani]|uniref:Uncharacterized protein n=1 Tax=Rhizoctonia solani TaxID=456999 RepID=A0A8H3HK90_9AGAM|nr:unnamed protein product [Rhizoctonia solani]
MEEYNSPKNLPTFNAWIDNCIWQGPASSGVHHLLPSVLNRTNLVSQCAKYYSSIKWQVGTYAGEKDAIVGIKRHGEELDSPEPNHNPGSDLILGSSSTIKVGPDQDDQLQNPIEFSNALFMFNPAVLNGTVQVMGEAEIQQTAVTDEPLGVPHLGSTQTMPQDAKPQVTGTNKVNSKANIRSRKTTMLATWEQKRLSLAGDNTKYAQPKYDSYFTLGAMSDEENTEAIDEKGKKVFELVSHEYDFVSDELVNCHQAIDAIPDPNQNSKKL